MGEHTSSTPAAMEARLFPLHGTVAFPYGILPLHIFEPRYRQMTSDALEHDRRIAIVLPLSNSSSEPVPIHSVACIGRISQEQRLPDGRYLFVLYGERRIKIEEELPPAWPGQLFRRARVRPLDETWDPSLEANRFLQKQQILEAIDLLTKDEGNTLRQFLQFVSPSSPIGMFSDIIGAFFPFSADVKQRLLETTDIDRRMAILVDEMKSRLGGSIPVRRLPFPPLFGDN